MVLWILVIFNLLLSIVNLFLAIKSRGALIKIIGPSIDTLQNKYEDLIKKLKKIL